LWKGRHTSSPRNGARAKFIGVISVQRGVGFRRNPGLEKFPIIQADIYSCALRLSSLWVSVGVLHHLPDPRAASSPLLRRSAPRLSLAGFYGAENTMDNAFVNPCARKSLPASTLGSVAVVQNSVGTVYAATKLVYGL